MRHFHQMFLLIHHERGRKTVISGIVMLLLLIMAGFPSTSIACDCSTPADIGAELEKSSAVFSGKVLDRYDANEDNHIQSSGDMILFLFGVDTIWKGSQQSEIIISTERNESSCGYEFQVGETYIVYANDVDGELYTSFCTRTGKLANAKEDLEFLGEGNRPSEIVSLELPSNNRESDANNTIIYVLGSVMGALILIGFFIRKRFCSTN